MKFLANFKSQSGQSLIEVLIATTVVTMVLTAIATAMTMSLKTVSESKYRSFANFYAQEAMEFFKRERVRLGWSGFETILADNLSTSVCLNSLPNNLVDLTAFASNCSEGIVLLGNDFKREVNIISEAEDKLVLEIVVFWYEGNDEKKVELEGVFKEY